MPLHRNPIIRAGIPTAMALSYLKNHEPRQEKDILGQEPALKELNDFLTNFKSQKKRGILIYGPPGCGKTASAVVLSRKYNLELVEVNASDHRNAKEIEERVGQAVKNQSLFFKGKLILIDEVDSIAGNEDRGGLGAIKEIVDTSPYPVILTANDIWDNKFSQLRNATKMVKFQDPDTQQIAKRLAGICAIEGILATPDGIMDLAKRAKGDFRAAINDLQSLSQTSKRLDLSILNDLSPRDKTESILTALATVFRGTLKEAKDAFMNVEENPDEIFQWLVENVPNEFSEPRELADAYDALSRADVYRGRIMRKQHWRFLIYKGAMETAGVNIAKQKRSTSYSQYKQSQRGLNIWRLNMKHQKRKVIAQKIADATHSSAKRIAQDVIPYVRVMCKNPQIKAQFKEEFGLDPEEANWLA